MAAAGVGQDPRLVLSHPSRFMASVYGLLHFRFHAIWRQHHSKRFIDLHQCA
jgi:hypothetical protein